LEYLLLTANPHSKIALDYLASLLRYFNPSSPTRCAI